MEKAPAMRLTPSPSRSPGATAPAGRSSSLPDSGSPTRRSDSGQAVVEAALVMPAMVLLVLGIMQLTMIQHARIMTDYAAFCAARAGIVYNADPAAMQRAAVLALLPTMGRTDDLANLTRTAATTLLVEQNARRVFNNLPIVQVEVLHPRQSEVPAAVTAHLNGREVDFDDVRPAAARANILQLQVRYFYKMPVPFANRMLQTIWFAQRAQFLAMWGGYNAVAPTLEGSRGQVSAIPATRARAAGTNISNITGLLMASAAGRYYFPLEATYSMRMQSNLYLNNLQP